MPGKECALNFKMQDIILIQKKNAILKSLSQLFGTMDVNETQHICLLVLDCYPE